MMPFRRILFPIDFSEATLAIVPNVTEIAQRFNATVTLLNAFNLLSDYIQATRFEGTGDSEPASLPYTPALQELRKQRQQCLDEFSREQFSSVNHTARIEDGDPAEVIHWVAQREDTDLITMPTRGIGRFRRLLVVSVTAKVLHDVSCTVWTSAHAAGPSPASAPCCRSILCAVVMNPEAGVVLKAAGFVAQAYGARICWLNSCPSPQMDGGQPFGRWVGHAFEKALGAGSHEIGLDTTVRVLDAAIPEGIRRIAIEESADLIVVGRGHHKGSLSRMWSRL